MTKLARRTYSVPNDVRLALDKVKPLLDALEREYIDRPVAEIKVTVVNQDSKRIYLEVWITDKDVIDLYIEIEDLLDYEDDLYTKRACGVLVMECN
jgi:hypothetical protein